jgi:hypothetical protein
MYLKHNLVHYNRRDVVNKERSSENDFRISLKTIIWKLSPSFEAHFIISSCDLSVHSRRYSECSQIRKIGDTFITNNSCLYLQFPQINPPLIHPRI